MPKLLRWFAANARDLPWRRTRDPYTIWVSEVMLQQTQVKTVVPYFESWMRELPDVASLAAAREQRVLKLWEGLGYYHRARNLKRAAIEIMRNYDGGFPRDFDAVLALPGVGRYTAGAICSIAFNEPVPVLDGNVKRVLTRVFAIRQSPRRNSVEKRLWSLAEELVEAAASAGKVRLRSMGGADAAIGACSAMNQSLMELGALVCTPRSPRCAECPLMDCCEARHLGIAEKLPAKAPRPKPSARRFVALVVVRGGRVLVRRRPEGGLNGGLWEFPNVEVGTSIARVEEVLCQIHPGTSRAGLTALCRVRQSITRYRVTVDAFLAGAGIIQPRPQEQWVTWRQLGRLPLPGAHAKIRKALTSRQEAR